MKIVLNNYWWNPGCSCFSGSVTLISGENPPTLLSFC